MRIIIEAKGNTAAELAANVAKLMEYATGDGQCYPGDFGIFEDHGSFSVRED